MNDRPPGPPPDDNDLGSPIEALADYAEEPGTGFLARVRRTIERRSLTRQLFDLSWFTPMLVFLEYIDLLFQGVFGLKNRRRKPDTEGTEP